MKRFVSLLFVLCCLFGSMKAQDYRMVSFDEMTNSMIAREHMMEDDNGNKCAVICVSTQDITPEIRQGFYFECDWGSEIVQKKSNGAEIWVWVSPGLKTLKVKHDSYGNIHVAVTEHVTKIESMHTYKMVLKGTMKSGGDSTPVITQQFLMFKVTPKDAVVTVDGTPWQVKDGIASNMVDFGKHEYRVQAKDYHPETGTVVVRESDETVTQNVDLKPAFGYLKLEGDMAILSKSSIYVDDANASQALTGSLKLSSGQHKLSIVNSKYKTYERRVDIFDGETNTLKVNLDANFSNITIKVDADADIYVNKVYKGKRQWNGDLEAGKYLIECQQKSHRSTSVEKTITDNMNGTTITLEAPKPINGVLVVNSDPPVAKIIIDGNIVGETPKQIKAILIGEHTLRLEKDGCAPLTKTINIEEGKTLSLNETLETGRSITVKTDRQGDKVYVDGTYVGETPLNTSLGFGKHKIRATRGQSVVEKEVDMTPTSRINEVIMEFGRLIKITTDRAGDKITIDGKPAGNSPLQIDLPFGKHSIHAQRGKLFADKNIEVSRSGGSVEHHLVLRGETPSEFVQRGVNFLTFDAAYSIAPQLSYGITFGSVRRVGWFLTAASNYSFDAMTTSLQTDPYETVIDGEIYELYGYVFNDPNFVEEINGETYPQYYYPAYTGKTSTTRISVMGGLVVRIAGPVYMRLGAGFGARYKGWNTSEGQIVRVPADCYLGVDAMSGLQLNLKGLSVSFDAVTTNFKTMELKLGVGFCWKRK